MEIDIIERYFHRLELHVPDAERVLPRLFGKQIRDNGGDYNECRGYQSDRFVKIQLDRPDGLALAEAILSRLPATCVIMRGPRAFNAGHRRLYMLDYSPGKHEFSHQLRVAYRASRSAGNDEVCTYSKAAGCYRDLQRPAQHLVRLVQEAAPQRQHNVVAHAVLGATEACRAFVQDLLAHLQAHREVSVALCVALERIELRVLKGELTPNVEHQISERLAA